MKVFAGKYIRMQKKKLAKLQRIVIQTLPWSLILTKQCLITVSTKSKGREVAWVLLRNLGQNGYNEERRAFEVERCLGGREGAGGGGQGGVDVARPARGVAGAPWQVPRCHRHTCSRLNLLLFAGKDKKFHKTLLVMMTAMGRPFKI